MRSLALPDRAEVRNHLIRALEIYNWGGEVKGYAVTDQELDSLIAIYDQYDAQLGIPDDQLKGPLLGEELKDAVKAGYRFIQSGSKLSKVRETLFKDVKHCPICGITAPRELDHHLPESVYRPLAVYVRNLVPYCHDCNQSKSAHESQDPTRRFIHPYFDILPDIQFVRATVTLNDAALVVEFEVDPSAGLVQPLYDRLSFQFARLRLSQRFQAEINTYLTGHTVALVNAFEADAVDGVRTFLAQQGAVERGAFHRNHWRPVLLGALANHVGFCDGGFRAVLPVQLVI